MSHSMEYFDNYNPEEEEIFGNCTQLAPKRVDVTQKQISDPLRRPKVLLSSYLTAEKQPITSETLIERMRIGEGKVLDHKIYGCKTMDELLQKCSATIVHHRDRAGRSLYTAKANDANIDILEMVAQQAADGSERKRVKSFLRSSKALRTSSYGASFKSYQGKRLQDQVIEKKTTSTKQIQARRELAPQKTVGRVKNLADLLRADFDKIAEPHPTEDNQTVVSLSALQEHFLSVYGLPVWGKKMTETELHNALSEDEFAGILNFFVLPGKNIVFVERPIEDESDFEDEIGDAQSSQCDETTQVDSQEEQPDASFNDNDTPTLCKSPGILSDIAGEDMDERALLESANDDGFFLTGPGFGAIDSAAPTPVPSNERIVGQANTSQDLGTSFSSMENGSLKNQPKNERRSVSDYEMGTGEEFVLSTREENDDDGWETDSTLAGKQAENGHEADDRGSVLNEKRAKLARSFRATESEKVNHLQTLVEFVQSKKSVLLESLAQRERQIVDHSSHIFKVSSTRIGKTQVSLINPNIDTSSLKFKFGDLRTPVESDVRWLCETKRSPPLGSRECKPVVFIPPRGFLLINTPSEEEAANDALQMDEIGGLLAEEVKSVSATLKFKEIKPGMGCVYMYNDGDETNLYRVIVLGKSHKSQDVLVMLADHDDQHFSDVNITDLYPLPSKVSFNNYPPTVIYAAISGINGVTEPCQKVIKRVVDDISRVKSFTPAYYWKDSGDILLFDALWAFDEDKVYWLSDILLEAGCEKSENAPSKHSNMFPVEVLHQVHHCDLLEFTICDEPIDARKIRKLEDFRTGFRGSQHALLSPPGLKADVINDTICAINTSATNKMTSMTVDLSDLFDQMFVEKNIYQVSAICTIVRGLAKNDPETWTPLKSRINRSLGDFQI